MPSRETVQKYLYTDKIQQSIRQKGIIEQKLANHPLLGKELDSIEKEFGLSKSFNEKINRFYIDNNSLTDFSVFRNMKNIESVLKAYGFSGAAIRSFLHTHGEMSVGNPEDFALRLAIFSKTNLLEEVLFYSTHYLGNSYSKLRVTTDELYALARNNNFKITLDDLDEFEKETRKAKDALVKKYPITEDIASFLIEDLNNYVKHGKGTNGCREYNLMGLLTSYGYSFDDVCEYMDTNNQVYIANPYDLITRLAIFEKANLLEEVLFNSKQYIENTYSKYVLSTKELYAFAVKNGFCFNLSDIDRFEDQSSLYKSLLVKRYPLVPEAIQLLGEDLKEYMDMIRAFNGESSLKLSREGNE